MTAVLVAPNIFVLDVYGDGDYLILAQYHPNIREIIDAWRVIDQRYCESDEDLNEWEPLTNWLESHGVTLLPFERLTI